MISSSHNSSNLVWLRLDLRLTDNPALAAAVERGGAVIPVFIHAPEEESPWLPGGASCWWLHQSLRELDARLRERGSRLVIRRGPVLATLHKLVKENGATAVFWNRRYEPAVITRDAKAKEGLNAAGLEVKCFNAGLATARARQWRWPGSIAGRCPRRNTRAN